MPSTFFDRLTEVLLAVVAVVFGWAWTIDRRVSKLETQHESICDKLDRMDEKLDRLFERRL